MANFAMTATVTDEGFKDAPGVDEAIEFVGVPATIAAGDTLTCTLPPRFQGKPLSLLSVTVDQYLTAAVAGAATKVSIPLAAATPPTFVEATGVVVVTLGSVGIANTQTPCCKIVVCPATI